MKRGMFLLVFVFGVMSISIAQAAEQAKPQAVAAPSANAGAKTIFDYQKEIGMSDKQVEDMKGLMANFQKVLGEKSTELTALRQDLAKMIQDKKEIPAIRQQLQKIADIQVDASIFDVETSRKVDAVLTPDQMAKWKTLQDTFKKEALAAQAAAQQAAK